MSLRVLVIPEDPTLDQYILKPVVARLFDDLERRARVEVLQNPRLRGVEQALAHDTLADIVATYPMVDLFLLIVDRDGDVGRHDRVAHIEARFAHLFACVAIEEIEVWMLALHRQRLGVDWQVVHSEPHVKERFARPFLADHAPALGPGAGRKWAMRDLGAGWPALVQICSEIRHLRDRVREWLGRQVTAS